MAVTSVCSTICFLLLAVISAVVLAGGARLVECEPPNCYGLVLDKDVEEFLRPSRASNMLSYLTRPRGLRSLDVIDAPSFGGSRTFGGFGYSQTDMKRGNAQQQTY